jgi:hypothetical protein
MEGKDRLSQQEHYYSRGCLPSKHTYTVCPVLVKSRTCYFYYGNLIALSILSSILSYNIVEVVYQVNIHTQFVLCWLNHVPAIFIMVT